jgi:sodium-coupled neutral amino acid transporter 7/8
VGGLLAFPVAFYSAGGILPALLVMMFLLVWIVVGLLVLAHLAENLQAATFEDVVGRACGPVVKAVVDGCIIVYTFGTCIAFLVVIGDQLQDLSSAVHIHGKAIAGEWWVNRKLLISLSALLFILPWLWMKRIGVLSLTSALGVVCCGYICLVVAVRYFIPYSDQTPANMTCPRVIPQECSRQWPDFFTAIPFICFGYQCHVSSVPIYAGLKTRSLRAYTPVVAVALCVCVAVYTVTGVFGYLTFHDHTCISSDILRNYCPQDPAIDVARVMLILVMITSYPILAFCGRCSLTHYNACVVCL